MDENQEFMIECLKEEMKGFAHGMLVLAVPIAAYWIFVG